MKSMNMINAMRRNLNLLLFIFVLTSAGTTFAQQGGGGGFFNATPEDRAKRLTEAMKEKLQLTTVQEPKVAAINLKYAKKMDTARNIADAAQRTKSITTLDSEKDAELKAIFTADQYKIYLKLKEEMKARRKR